MRNARRRRNACDISVEGGLAREMQDTNNAPLTLDERGRIYKVDPGTQLLNWLCAAVFVACFLGCALFVFSGAGPAKIKIGLAAPIFLFFALYSVRFNQLATFLYPDRIVSRGLFRQTCLYRDNIAGYELISGTGLPRLKLKPKNPAHKCLYVNRFSADVTFENWLSEFPDLGLKPASAGRRQG